MKKDYLRINGFGTDEFFYQFQIRLNNHLDNLIKNCDKRDFFITNLMSSFSYKLMFDLLIMETIENTHYKPKKGSYKFTISNVDFFIDLTKIQIVRQSEIMVIKRSWYNSYFPFQWKRVGYSQNKEIGIVESGYNKREFSDLKISKEKFYNISTKVLTLIKKSFISAAFFCNENSVPILSLDASSNHRGVFRIEGFNLSLFKILANRSENKTTEIEKVLLLFADFACMTEEKLILNIDQHEQIAKIILDFNKLKEELLLLTKSMV